MEKNEQCHPKINSNKYTNLDIHVQKAVKNCNVKLFVSARGLGTNEIPFQKINQNDSLSGHLLHLKSSCSEAFKDIRSKEGDTLKMKSEADFKDEKIKLIKNEKQLLQNRVSQLHQQFDKVKMKKQSVFHSLKTYQHILDRMRKDSITYRLRRNQLENELRKLQKNKQQIQTQFCALKQFQSLSKIGLKDAKLEHHLQTSQRANKLNTINHALIMKKQNDCKKKERQTQTQIIQQMAAGDLQDAQLLRIKRFLTVQRFVKFILKEKIIRLKKFFEPYQLAFFKIKSSTNAKDANQMKKNFFNFEANFSQKSSWVKHIQQEIEQAQKYNSSLLQSYKNLRQEYLQMIEQFEQQNNQTNTHQLQQISKKQFKYQLTMMKIKQWLHQLAKRFFIDTNQSLEKIFNQLCKQLRAKKKMQQISNQISPKIQKPENIQISD